VVATPSLTLTITPPGGSATDYTRYLAWSGSSNQGTINQNFGRQGDTATLPLVDEYTTTPNVVIKDLSQVKLFDNIANVTLFAGVVTNPQLLVSGPNRNEWNLVCTDYTYYADNAIVQGVFYGLTVDQIIVALTQQANCGITAAQKSAGGFVAPGPTLAAFVLNWTKLSDAWRKLSQLAGQVTPFGWFVDENRNLHFYDATSAIASGVTFTTAPTAAGSTTEGHIALDGQALYEWDGTSIRNRILVQGATQTIMSPTTGAATDTFLGNGYNTSFPLRYSATGSPTLKVNGVQTSVTVVSGGGSTSAAWSIQQNAFGGWFLIAASAPAAGTTIQIWYNYDVPIVAQANDLNSQATYTGPNGGIFAEFISDSSLTTTPMALARAMRERTEYNFAVERFTWTSTEEFLGWVRSGETCTVVNSLIPDSRNSYTLGINSTFLVVSNRVTIGRGGYRTMSLTGVRL
jgi:hypothetical protein